MPVCTSRILVGIALQCVALGCRGGDGGGGTGETGFVTEATTTSFTAGSTSTTSGVDASTGDGSGSTAATDDATGSGEAGSTGITPGCTAIDFLYVVDNGTTMLPHQQALVADFPMFADTIEVAVPASENFHLMVVKTDEGWGADCIDECAELGGCMTDPNFACDAALRGCDAALGGGVLFPYGEGGTNLACDIVGDARYVVAEEPDVNPAFTCLAMLGTRTYDTPRTAEALLAALSASGSGGCNEGFVRQDALLVVTILTDKDDDDSPGTAAQWADAVLAAKGGDADAIVALGIVDEAGSCGEASDALAGLVSSFPHSALANVCSDDYESFLLAAVDLIGSTCDAWLPPG
jgi:hypothetical protein